MLQTGKNLQFASGDGSEDHLCRFQDTPLFPASGYYFHSGGGHHGFQGITAVGLREGNQIRLADGAGVPVIVLKQALWDAQLRRLPPGKPPLFDETVAHGKGGAD